MAYLSTSDIQFVTAILSVAHPSFTELITLPNASHEGKAIRALRVGNGSDPNRPGLLLIGGTHARELINPDLLTSFALDLCDAYASGTGLTYGSKSYPASTVKLIVDVLNVFILPLLNPDGRDFVLDPSGDAWWRKNRNPNPGQPCKGVDLNRNFDFLHSTGIGTSSDSCSEVFRGPGAFSEPETDNVRQLLDARPGIGCMVDIHSYSQLVLYPWGHADSQTADSDMNFQNPAYVPSIGSPGYAEFIEPDDLTHFVNAANRMRDGIATYRGRMYTVQPSYDLYPTSGTSLDYGYSRHLVDTGKRKIHAYALETALEFQPDYSEAEEVMEEVSIGLMELLLDCICPVEAAAALSQLIRDILESLGGQTGGSGGGGGGGESHLAFLRRFRDDELNNTAAGVRYAKLLRRHQGELTRMLLERDTLLVGIEKALPNVIRAVVHRDDAKKGEVGQRLLKQLDSLMGTVAKGASAALAADLESLRSELPVFGGGTLSQGLKKASRRSANKPKRKGKR